MANTALPRQSSRPTAESKEAIVAGAPNRKIIKPKLLEYLMKFPNQTQYVGDLAASLGVEDQNVRNTMNGIIRENTLPGLEIIVKGRSWVYRPDPKVGQSRGARVFEELAETKSGDIIIQDQDGRLYRAKELE
jgi:hypothetical protein